MKKIIMVLFVVLVLFGCEDRTMKKSLKTFNYDGQNLIYGEWILEKSSYKKRLKMRMPIENVYDCINIDHSYEKKKVSSEVAVLYNLAWDIRIIEIIGKFPEYKLKFKYNESETIDNEGNIISDWLDGEMIMHFINEDEVWFELVYVQRGERNKTWIFDDLIKYGKDNVYKREK